MREAGVRDACRGKEAGRQGQRELNAERFPLLIGLQTHRVLSETTLTEGYPPPGMAVTHHSVVRFRSKYFSEVRECAQCACSTSAMAAVDCGTREMRVDL